jgi:methyl-accepting chemotaxis protein
MPDPAAGPASPIVGSFHRKVALTLAAATAVAAAVLILAVYGLGQHYLTLGAKLRADAMARSAAAALAPETLPREATALLERLRDAAPDAVAVTLRDAGGATLAQATRPLPAGMAAAGLDELPVGRARLSDGAALAPGGSLEYTLQGSTLRVLLSRTVVIMVVIGLGVVAVVGLASGAMARGLTAPLRGLVDDARRMAQGDLRVELAVQGRDEMAELSAHFNALAQGLRRMIGDLRGAAEQVGAATAAIGQTSRTQVKNVLGQTSALEETAATVSEMTVASRLATESAQLVIEVATRSEKLWQQGAAAVREGQVGLGTLDGKMQAIAGAVTELSERTVQLGTIIATVKDLAEQSNVLALNAAIEAAKVGDAGMGFAVVAEEMRRLAEQSRRATDEVRGLLVELQRATRKVVVATGDGSAQARAAVAGAAQASSTIDGLAGAIENSSRTARGIADTTRRQTEEIEGIATSVTYLSANMAEAVAGAHRIEEVARELARVSDLLTEAVAAYRT